MKTILQRQDNTSIFCSPLYRRYSASTKKKLIELTVACTLLTIGLFIMTVTL